MLTLIYRLLVVFLILVIGYDVFKEKRTSLQLTAAIALVPLVLRLLLIK
ncbi:hypothetical protein JW960_16000 [candidate division KSB1 bacterium]|nr:hypothetical protein [candidate division KSB1 bacterium]